MPARRDGTVAENDSRTEQDGQGHLIMQLGRQAVDIASGIVARFVKGDVLISAYVCRHAVSTELLHPCET